MMLFPLSSDRVKQSLMGEEGLVVSQQGKRYTINA